jgi:hypothetical protein
MLKALAIALTALPLAAEASGSRNSNAPLLFILVPIAFVVWILFKKK